MANYSFGIEPASEGVVRIEIDESKIIGNNNIVYYMFGMIDSYTHVYCVLDNRTKESLLPIIKKDIFTCEDIKVNNYHSAEDLPK